MAEQSSLHAYLAWTKQRLDEMDAILASFEVTASQLRADAKTEAARIIASLKKRRNEFESEAKEHAEAGAAAFQASKSQLESRWAKFEAEVKIYVEMVSKDVEQKRSTFMSIATAQAKAWSEVADGVHVAATKLGAEHSARAKSAVAQIRSDAAEAKARLEKIKQAGDESWSALSVALEASRKAFDEANQKAWDALKGSASKKG